MPSSICLSDFGYSLRCSVGAVCRRRSGLPYFWGNLVQLCSLSIFNFSENRVEFFLSERSQFNVQLLTNYSGHWFMRYFRWVSW